MWNQSKLPPVPAPCLPSAIDKTDVRGNAAFAFRYGTAAQAQFAPAPQTPNGEETKYADKSATYSKGLKQKSHGIVDPEVFKAFRGALGTSDGLTVGVMNFGDPNIILGGYSEQHTTPAFYTELDGPAGAFALALGAAMRRLSLRLRRSKWTGLLRDAPFAEYRINPIAIAAANGLTKLRTKFGGHYYGPVNESGMVTPDLLFRGGPRQIGDKTYFASAALTDLDDWYAAQNGKVDGANLVDGVRRHIRNGRALCSDTHSAEISQAYFVAYLVLKSQA
jgi:hypothetical protein